MATLLNPPASPGHAASESETAKIATGWAAPLRLWHLLSLDAPTVAVAWMAALAWAAHRPLHAWSASALALIVWVIYVGDRVLDARAAISTAQNIFGLQARHWFHWRHRQILLPLATLAGLAAAALILSQMPRWALPADTFVAAATLLWLGGVHFGSKERVSAEARERLAEIAVGLIFVAGCSAPVWPQSPAAFLKLAMMPAFAFAALAWLNLYSIGAWESARHKTRVRFASAMVAALGLVLACAAALLAEPRAAALLLCAAASAMMIALLDALRRKIAPVTLRAAADFVLILPLAAVMALALTK